MAVTGIDHLKEHFRAIGYTEDNLAFIASDRIAKSLGSLLYKTAEPTTLNSAIRTFLLHQPCALDTVLPPSLCRELEEEGLLDHTSAGWVSAYNVVPLRMGERDHWVFSDLDPLSGHHRLSADHVMGVGQASRSLLAMTPTSPVDSVLDLGTGAGVQLLGQAECAQVLVGTDISERALDCARWTLSELASADRGPALELLAGSWFEPVAGRRFDRIIANPPFVIAPPTPGHEYRQSQLDRDGASELVISQVSEYLNPGGTAHIVAAWALQPGEEWAHHVAAWLPETGVSCWLIQRDEVDAATYVNTWMLDEHLDLDDPAVIEQIQRWLDYLDECGITRIGLGHVHIHRCADPTVPTAIEAEEILTDLGPHLGDEVELFFTRRNWLATQTADSLLDARYRLDPAVFLDRVATADAKAQIGFTPAAVRMGRLDAPYPPRSVDEATVSILSGLSPDGLTLREVSELYAAAQGLDEAAILDAAGRMIVDAIRLGLVEPVGMTASETGGA
ncbi:MAG: methyltransferase [Corynebacterium sp.]|nr:methyltransferase [Corynebacterium sp.]